MFLLLYGIVRIFNKQYSHRSSILNTIFPFRASSRAAVCSFIRIASTFRPDARPSHRRRSGPLRAAKCTTIVAHCTYDKHRFTRVLRTPTFTGIVPLLHPQRATILINDVRNFRCRPVVVIVFRLPSTNVGGIARRGFRPRVQRPSSVPRGHGNIISARRGDVWASPRACANIFRGQW